MKYLLNGKFDVKDDTFFSGKCINDNGSFTYHLAVPLEEIIDFSELPQIKNLVIDFVECDKSVQEAIDYWEEKDNFLHGKV